ncbi:hypothetical protein [Treponema zioleckii]|uniref:hypothetical protein n=1 Tax=Treponema zioleckii TaxID=331680 RepID=UPI00168BDB73|nr:hypothetical protein [Treponema zioleckii]
MKKMKNLRCSKNCLLIAAGLVLLSAFFSCSSSPKRAMQITEIASKADERYETANSELISGKIEDGAVHLVQAYNYAVSIDDSDLLTRIFLSGISYKITVQGLGVSVEKESSFLTLEPEVMLSKAKMFANRSERKNLLSAICAIYEVRLNIAQSGTDYAAYIEKLSATEKSVQKEAWYFAYLKRIKGDIYMLAQDFSNAEESYRSAAAVHTKNRYLVEIGLDWYSVARACSQAGKKSEAVKAIETALKYDRAAENSTGIATDHFAHAKILSKGEEITDEELMLAKNSAEWAEEIYTVIGNEFQASQASALKLELEEKISVREAEKNSLNQSNGL